MPEQEPIAKHTIKLPEKPWKLEADGILDALIVDPTEGLSQEEAKIRLRTFGKNALAEERPSSKISIFLRQFKSPLIFVLVIAGIITFALGERIDSVVIFGAVLLNTAIGYFQENKATRSLFALKQILRKKALVFRETEEYEVPQEHLVPGDIIIVRAGTSIPADARLFETWQLQVNEASLTGEWIASDKHARLMGEETPLADRDNMLYMGTLVEQGTGKAVVVATGSHTALGGIATLLKDVQEEKTPYQRKLARFSWIIGIGVSILSVLIFLQGTVFSNNFTSERMIEMFTIAVAIAVAAIPEGLPIAMTIVLALGMQRILANKGLVRRLASAETLGSTSIIVTDKTLTLTEGRMEVEEIFTRKEKDRELALQTAALANEAFVENPKSMFDKWKLNGRPTDNALLKAALDAGIAKTVLEEKYPLLFRIPFDSERKYIVSFHRTSSRGNKVRGYFSGAPERILELTKSTKKDRRQAELKLEDLTAKGLRVVALAYKDLTLTKEAIQRLQEGKKDKEAIQALEEKMENLTFVGFIALKDPLRKDVKKAIRFAREAGLQIIIATGDHLLTARAVGKELGLKVTAESSIEGKDLDAMSDMELQDRLPAISIFARVEPAHKLRIIEAWQKRGEVVAMTGDGVNDAPALKKADIGLALGSGTEVAKEAADLILLTDNFSIIPAAIKEGRVITDNIRKIVTYLLASSFTETILISAAIIFKAPFLPVTALQILFVNLLVDGLPGVALTLEKEEDDVMKRPPQKRDAPLLTSEMKAIIFFIGIFTDIILLGLFFLLFSNTGYSPERIQTIIFVGLGFGSLFYAFSCKSLRKNIWQYNPFSNKFLNWSTLGGFVLLILAVYMPPLNSLLGTDSADPLSLYDWSLLLGLGLLNLVFIEAAKWYYIHQRKILEKNKAKP